MQLKISSKKGQIHGRKMIFYLIFFGFFLTIYLGLVVYFAQSEWAEKSNIPVGLENYLLAQRFLDSQLCFTFQDDNDRVYPWVIDLKKFNQENLNECYNAKSRDVKAYRLTLDYNNEKKIISTKNWEGFLKSAQTKRVFVYDDEKLKEADIFVEMQDAK